MSGKRYIHISNWDRFQHPDTTRAKASAIPWIKSYTGQLGDEDYVELGWADRGLLEALRLQYATNRGRGINDSTTNLQRLFGQRVLRVQLDRLNQAGFITLSASKALASCKQPASTEKEKDTEVEREQDQEQDQTQPTQPVARPRRPEPELDRPAGWVGETNGLARLDPHLTLAAARTKETT